MTFATSELTRARVARRLIALLLIVFGAIACAMSVFGIGGALSDARLVITVLFLILGPGWSAAGFLRRAPAAHVWLLAVGVGVSVTLLVGQIMVSLHAWRPAIALYVVAGLCVPFLLRHAVVAQ
jgi:hypothetical protein